MSSNKDFDISFAPQDSIYRYPDKIDAILDAIGIRNAWLSDQSAVSDFLLNEDACAVIADKLGISVSPDDLIVDLVERMVAAERQVN